MGEGREGGENRERIERGRGVKVIIIIKWVVVNGEGWMVYPDRRVG